MEAYVMHLLSNIFLNVRSVFTDTYLIHTNRVFSIKQRNQTKQIKPIKNQTRRDIPRGCRQQSRLEAPALLLPMR